MHAMITIHLIYKWQGADKFAFAGLLQKDQAEPGAEFMPNYGHRTFCSLHIWDPGVYSSLPKSPTPQ